MKADNRRSLLRGFVALLVLAATVSAIVMLQVAERRRADEEVTQLTAARTKQLRELVAGHLSTLELRAQNAGANPRLVAALSANVNRETLQDLFSTESWWQTFREAFSGTYLAPPGGGITFIAGRNPELLPADALVARVRSSRWVASALVPGQGRVNAVVAVPVIMPNPDNTPVLLFTQPFEGVALGQIAERTGEAVLLSDGTAPLAGAGPAPQTAVLKAASAVGAPRTGDIPDGSAVAAAEVAPGLWLLGHVGTRAATDRATAAFLAIRIAVGVVGGVLFILLLWSARRSPRDERERDRDRALDNTPAPVPAAAPAPVPAPVTDSGSGSRYMLLQRLGGGGMAEVHLAVAVGERGFRRPCVVKRLRPELTDNPAAVAQFTDEATLASSLVHANIVPIFDFAKVGDQYFLVEEYILGRDLGRVVRRAAEMGRALTAQMVAYVGVEALKALDYAHNKRDHDGVPLRIVHRDVSPENIMITLRGEVQLLDFGVLKSDASRSRRQGTEVGELKGNLNFMAPEQARGQEVDGRADLFALGLVLYFAITGEPLYGQDTGYDLLLKAASGPGPAELAKLSSLPSPFPSVLYRVLSGRPEARFPDAFSFAEALAPAVGDAGLSLGSLVTELYEEELAQEQQQLSASSAGRLTGSGALGGKR
jgi:eukaryotic-like serine/threonine-protein kinase